MQPLTASFDRGVIDSLIFIMACVAAAWTLVFFRWTQAFRHSPIICSQWFTKGPAPLISVIIPARNEGSRIPSSLESILTQDYPNIQVIVVDDCSTDSTLSIARSYAGRERDLTVIEAGDHPDGWTGKTWACHMGARHANGEWFLFTDADTVHAKNSLSSAYALASTTGADVLSLIPAIELKATSAKAVVPLLGAVIEILYPVRKVNDPSSSLAYTFGSYTFVKKEAYFKIGGYEAVKNRIVEDRAFGEIVKRRGLKLYLAKGHDLISSKWADRFMDVWHGLQRVISSSVAGNVLGGILFAAAAFVMLLFPFIVAPAVTYWLIAGSYVGQNLHVVLGLSLYSIAAFMCIIAVRVRQYPGGGVGILLAPFGAALLTLVLLTTVYRTFTGKPLVWKGRTYSA